MRYSTPTSPSGLVPEAYDICIPDCPPPPSPVVRWSEYHQLLVAMLEQAVRDLLIPAERSAVVIWMLRADEDLCGFGWVCTHLGIDPSYMRQRAFERARLGLRAVYTRPRTAHDVRSGVRAS